MPNKPHAPRGPKKTAPAPAVAGSSKDAASSNKKGKGPGLKEDDDKKTAGKKTAGKTKVDLKAQPLEEEPPKKPDTRTLIGGASWTGKLPVTLFAELCQKQKWNKPEYTMVCI
jgi:ATP-dependent RNA helicase DHX57